MDEHAEPYRYTGYLIRRAQQRHVAAWSRLVSTETSSVQYAVLTVLDRLGECSQRELCTEVDLDRSTIADLVARMEQRGLLTRQRAAEDRRRNVLVLTPQGRAELNRLRPGVEAVERELTGGLEASERTGLRAALRRILDG
ncbi:MAG TPA: MarR family winged helix-turn-helix transcriptional regulator [Solirubrobacter sp.]|nr:MarR family winged helix-turn-helix transcriptional regulator [Solirubrobacter sp.]